MPDIETVTVNHLLADPSAAEAQPMSHSEARMEEVRNLGWLVAREATEFGSPFGALRPYSRGRWLMPTRGESAERTVDRIVTLPDWSTFEESVTEVCIGSSDPEAVRAFLVDDTSIRKNGRQLLIFTAPEAG